MRKVIDIRRAMEVLKKHDEFWSEHDLSGIPDHIFDRVGSLRSPFTLLGTLAGLIFIGTGAYNIAQMLLAISRSSVESKAIITLVFVFVPIILGILALRVALRRREQKGIGPRVAIFVLGVVALFAWTGQYVGPALALLASIMPAYRSFPSQKA